MHFDIKNVTLGQKMVIWQVQFWIFGLWVGFDPPRTESEKKSPAPNRVKLVRVYDPKYCLFRN